MRYGIGNDPLPLTKTQYKFTILLPVYNEELSLLVEGVESIINSDYEPSRMEVHIAFDNGELSPLYIGFLKHFRINNYNWATSVVSEVRGVTMWVHRWPHGGKRNAQALTFNFIRDIFDDRKRRYLNPRKSTAAMRQHILVMTDSDNFLYNNALRNLAHNFDKNPEKAALAGYMTCMSSGWKAVNFLRLMQDTEYVGGEMNRSFELMMGTVNCLPGGFTAMRYDALLSVADRYFTTLDNETITDFHRNYLGEDRYLTHIMHQVFPRYSMGFCPSARCKTDPPPSVMKLVKQRRRWWLGAISNEAYMLTDIEIWKKYKFMIIFKLFQLSWKALTVSQLILAALAISGLDKNNMLPYVLSVGIPLCTAWVVTILTGVKLGHYKVIWMYPLMQIPNTLVCFFVDVYTLCTWYTRSWGGARFEGKYEKAEGAA
ncbi:hypothetical protein HDU85_000652 [Gaertneriomyces sp. JEL0708]|nr:hypothetical protein HDU85_000652 [Gaertneriomyces sp. JEL0708]